jgi:hypothetical protein
MSLRLREADCPQTAFIEANGDLRAQRALRRKSISRNPAEPVLRIAVADIRSLNRCPQPNNQSQEAIQYP